MAVSYNKLWKLMIDKGLNKTKLRTEAGISSNAMAKLGKNESVQVEVLVKICNHLNCTMNDIMEIIPDNLEKIEALKDEIDDYANIRRSQMLYLYNSFGGKGDREQWCLVKHLSMAMYTAFEAYQASDRDPELLNIALEINKKFIEACTKFLGVEITSCASCFADIMKAGGK